MTDVEEVNEEMVMGWALQHSGASGFWELGLVKGSWVMQIVEVLSEMRGAAVRTCTPHQGLGKAVFSWAQVHHLVEASMDGADCQVMIVEG